MRLSLIRGAGALLLLCLCVPGWANNDPPPPVVLRHVRLVQADGEQAELTIVMQGGRFIAVAAEASVPAGAEVIDATGLVAYPGFVDAATDRGFRGGEPGGAERRNREDVVQDAIAGPLPRTSEAWRHAVHPTWNLIDRYGANAAAAGDHRKCGFTTALVMPPHGMLAGQAGVLQLGDQPLRRSLLRGVAAQCAALVPGPGDEYPNTLAGAVAFFRQTMLDAQWLRQAGGIKRDASSPALPSDPDLESLWPVLPDGNNVASMPVLFDVMADEGAIHRALDVAVEFRLRPILLVGNDAWKCIDRLKREQPAVIVSLALPEEPKLNHKGTWAETMAYACATAPATAPATLESGHGGTLFDDDWHQRAFEPQRAVQERRRLWEERRDCARRLHEAGIAVAFSTRGAKSPEESLGNLRKMIAAGLPAAVALRGLTTQATAVWGVGDRAGRVATGQPANLVVMGGPFESNESKARFVFVDGRKYAFDAKCDDNKTAATASSTAATASSAAATTAPATATSPTVESVNNYPTWATEIEADRAPAFRTGGNVLLRGGTVLTIVSGDQSDTDVLIQGGRITSIGKGLVAPPDTTIVELNGLYVSPGIIDCHSHMGLSGGLNESSLSVTPEVRMSDLVEHDDVGLYRALAGGVTMIHTMHGSANTIGGQNVVLKLKWNRPSAELIARDAPRTVKFALGENVKRSNGPGNRTRFPASRMGVETTLRRALSAAREYAEKAKTARTPTGDGTLPLRRDLRLEALGEVLAGRIWVHSHCYRADEILRLLEVAEEFGFRVGVLQHVLEGYRIIPEILRHGCAASTFSDWWRYKVEASDAVPHNAARMAQAGIVATVNSDSADLVRHLPLEAAKSVRFGGLSINDALRLVTLNGAATLGMADKTGSIEVGKHGDIAVFTGHPIDTFSRCVLTLVEGEVYFHARDLLDAATTATSTVAPSAAAATQPRSRQVLNAAIPARPALATGQHSSVAARLEIPPSPTGQYAIRGATIHPISGSAITNGVVVFSPGGIRSVGPANTPIPAGITVVDATGLHVYPGLINAATTLGLADIGSVPATNDQRELGQFQPDVWAGSAINSHSELIPVARCEGVTTVLVIPTGGAIAGRCALVHTDGWTLPDMLIRAPLQGAAANPMGGGMPFGPLAVNLPTLPVNLPAESRDKQLADNKDAWREIEDYFRAARRYAEAAPPGAAAAEWVKSRDERLEAMRPYVLGQLPILVSADGIKDMLEAIRFADRLGLQLILRGADEAWKIADELATRRIGLIVAGPPNLPRGQFDPFDAVFANAGRLAQAGARFGFGGGEASLTKLVATDAGMAVAYGLDEDRALYALTLGAAEVLGVADRLGSLTPNKMADLIVCDGNPCQASSTIRAVFINGRPTDLTSIHTRHDDRFRNRPAPTLPPMRRDLKGPPAIRIAK